MTVSVDDAAVSPDGIGETAVGANHAVEPTVGLLAPDEGSGGDE